VGQKTGLYVLLRIGPYICAETNFGGLPPWLIREPGLVTRTNNEPVKREVLTWCKTLMPQIGRFQASRGGPIIMAQLENEYNVISKRFGPDAEKYMDWVVASSKEIGLEVPLLMCEAPTDTKLEISRNSMAHAIKEAQNAVTVNRLGVVWRLMSYVKP